jgi:hypothetical protein
LLTMFDPKIRQFALDQLRKEYEAGNIELVLQVLGWVSEDQEGYTLDDELLWRLDRFGRERMEQSKIERE